jgi:hypothetical protein
MAAATLQNARYSAVIFKIWLGTFEKNYTLDLMPFFIAAIWEQRERYDDAFSDLAVGHAQQYRRCTVSQKSGVHNNTTFWPAFYHLLLQYIFLRHLTSERHRCYFLKEIICLSIHSASSSVFDLDAITTSERCLEHESAAAALSLSLSLSDWTPISAAFK